MEERLLGGNKLKIFNWQGLKLPVTFVETMSVKEGVECDVYLLDGHDKADLAIVRVKAGHTTPLQRVLQGERTVEGHFSGSGKLIIQRTNGELEVYSTGRNGQSFSAIAQIEDIVQWEADPKIGLVFCEVCLPPYADGRFENLT